jgi:hypothetical protein
VEERYTLMPTSASKHGLPRQMSSPNTHAPVPRGIGIHDQIHIPPDGHVLLPVAAASTISPVTLTTTSISVSTVVSTKDNKE